MAGDFLLSALLTISAEDALKQLKDVGKEAKDAGDDIEDMGSGSELSAAKMAVAFTALGNVTSGIWDSMLEASPSLQIAMLEIDMSMEEIYRTLGEALAPIIEEVILPLVEQFVEWFMSLDSETQTLIASVIGITMAMSALAPVLVGIISLVGALSWPILAVVAAIAALVFIWTTDFMGLRTMIEEWWVEGIQPIFEELSMAFTDAGGDFAAFWEVVEPIISTIVRAFVDNFLGSIQNVFGFVVDSITSVIGIFTSLGALISAIFGGDIPGILDALGDLFHNVFDLILGNALDLAMAQLRSFGDYISDIFDAIGQILGAIFGDGLTNTMGVIFDTIKGLINGLIAILNDFIIGTINDVLGGIKGVNIAGAHPFGWIELLGDIPSLAIGGMVPGSGPVPMIGHGGEEMLQKTNPRHISNLGTNGGSGMVFYNTFQITAKTGMDRRELQELGDNVAQYMERQMQLKGKY